MKWIIILQVYLMYIEKKIGWTLGIQNDVSFDYKGFWKF